MIGVTLASRAGYFRQEIAQGRQIEHPDPWDPAEWCQRLPARVAVRTGEREVWIGAWLYQVESGVGRPIPVILLDTDMADNDSADREITHRLYGDGAAYRLKQEIVLGIGGVRMLAALGGEVRKYHLNEGHAAFLKLELLRREGGGESADPLRDIPPCAAWRKMSGHAGRSTPAVPAAPADDPHADHGAARAPDPHAGHDAASSPYRTLAYSDLRALNPQSAPPATLEVQARLTGVMWRSIWTVNGEKLGESQPVRLRLGQRVRLSMVNETMMEDPMHLHGSFARLENGQGAAGPMKHTFIVKPAQTVAVEFHCRHRRPLGLSLPSLLPRWGHGVSGGRRKR